MNTELLKQLYCIYSPSRNTKKMSRFLKKQITRRGGTYIKDQAGNILVTKGVAETYPCLASHYDQVSNHRHPKDFRCIESGDIIMGYSNSHKMQCGLGADDKNGIFICLNALEKYDVIKIAFFADEEIGCQGSSVVDLSFFADCRFVIEPDRRGGSDLITTMSGTQVCSEEFVTDIGFQSFGYDHADGTITDVLTMLENGLGISCLNLSCGYYNAHTNEEVTVVSELENCQNFVFHMIDTMQNVYPFEFMDKWSYGGYSNYEFWDDTEYDIMENIIVNNPDMTFEEILQYNDVFVSKNEEYLRQVYDDVRDYHAM